MTNEDEKVQIESNFPTSDSEVTYNNTAANEWIAAEPDLEFKALKQKIVDSLQFVSAEDFSEAAQKCLDAAIKSLGKEKCIVLWDGKPHSSKRWLFEQFKSGFDDQVEKAQYFGKYDQMDGYKEFEYLHTNSTDTFVIFDDAIYSGEQVINKGIRLIIEMYKRLGLYTGDSETDRLPKIVIVAPYVTNYFLNQPIIKQGIAEGMIELHYEHIMPSLGETIGEDGKDLLKERDFELDTPEQAIKRSDNDPHYNQVSMAPTLTAFSHRVADAHSFVEPVANRLKVKAKIPYKQDNTQYYQQEETEFKNYQQRILNRN